MIKPIETIYNGYKFRSRLEARWAFFFDNLNITYEYEKEGFDIDGEWYLPDFWIPQWNCWVEIKPNIPKAREFHKSYEEKDKRENRLCYKLSQNERKVVLLIGGNPWVDIPNTESYEKYLFKYRITIFVPEDKVIDIGKEKSIEIIDENNWLSINYNFYMLPLALYGFICDQYKYLSLIHISQGIVR